MRMRVMLAALTAIALGAAACGEPGTAGDGAESATTTAAPEATTAAPDTTTTTDPGPPKYNVSLDVAYLEDYSSVYHVGFPPGSPDTTYGFEVTYHLNATIEEAEFVEPDAAGTLDWWIYDYDYMAIELVDFWTGTESADFDVPVGSAMFGSRATNASGDPTTIDESVWHLGAAVRLETRGDELWLVHRLPAAAEMADPPEDTPWNYWSAWALVWGPGRIAAHIADQGEPQDAYWDGWWHSAREGEGSPNYLNPTFEQAGWVVWSMPLDDIGLEAHDIDFELRENETQHLYEMHVTGTISRASN